MKFVGVPIDILDDKNISPITKILFGLIITLSQKEGYCFATNKYLSDLMNISKRTITNSISSLNKHNYINISYELNMRKIYIAKNYYDS